MKLDRISGNTECYGGGLQAFCTACRGLNGSPLSEQSQDGEKLPDNLRLYACRFCNHRFEVEVSSSALAEVAPVISPGTSTITVPCPWCGTSNEHNAEAWPSVNAGGVFTVLPFTTFEVDCCECHAVYVLRPQAE